MEGNRAKRTAASDSKVIAAVPRRVAVAAVLPLALVVLALLLPIAVAHASGDVLPEAAASATPTTLKTAVPGPPVEGSTMTPAVTPPPGSQTWERDTLRDIAEVLEWPPIVTQDANGRLSVQRVVTDSVWAMASIKAYEFQAGAQAAFEASKEDARLAGFEVTSELFYGHPAYSATLAEVGGSIKRQYFWRADRWMMGVEARGSVPGFDQQTTAVTLLALAYQYGLPLPPGGIIPTVSVVPHPSITPNPNATAVSTPCSVDFSDVSPGYWAHGHITALACQGIVSGYADGTFRPQNATTRGQLVKMIVLSEGWQSAPPSEPSFVDVGANHVFFRYIEIANARGIVSGYSDGTFRPNDFVTRAQVAKMVVLARGWPLRVSAPAELCDVASDHWASIYVQVAIERGLFTGYGDGCFYPDAAATRAQLAKVLVLAYR